MAKRGRKEKFTKEQMVEALIAKKGMKTIAARYLGCDLNTVTRYIDKYACVREALETAKQSMGDNIESTLLNQALGERKEDGTWKTAPNIPALIFISKTHPSMRERGYGERKIVEHSGKMEHDIKTTGDKQLDTILAILNSKTEG
jgi:hypothetical protein